MKPLLTIARCREILGHEAEDLTDAQVAELRDTLHSAASLMLRLWTPDEMRRVAGDRIRTREEAN